MSATFTAAAKAMTDNEELRNQVLAAGSAEERAAILREAGVEVPTHADVNAAHADMAGVAGGANTLTYVTNIAPAAAPAAAAGAAAA